LRTIGQDARAEVFFADQGKAGFVRGATGGQEIVAERLRAYLDERPADARVITSKIVEAPGHAKAARKRAR